ncbi:MAG TPA: hypothetical protein VKQ72_03725 [Aggregatilineales bacterium]|nr:hypothetical protein [Aggregatilineales bacterium]
MAKPNLELYQGETVLQEGPVNMRLGTWSGQRSGTAYITNQRVLAYTYSNTVYYLFGLIGSLLIRMLSKPDLSLDLPFDEIKSVARGRILMNKNVLDLETNQGEKYHLLLKWDQFFPVLQNALTSAKFQLVSSGDNAWTVSK